MVVQHALVVDDSKSARVMLSRLLQKGGMKVDLVESAEDALAYLKSSKPDVVFMDHMMPGMDGLEATRSISQNPLTASIPIVMYTSKEGAAYLQEAKASGAVGVLPKPAKSPQIAALLELVNAHLSGDIKVSSSVVADSTTGLSRTDVEKLVEEIVLNTVAREMKSYLEANPSAVKSILDESFASVNESLGFLEAKIDLTDAAVNTLNNQLQDTNKSVVAQDARCQQVSEQVNTKMGESMSLKQVDEVVSLSLNEKLSELDQKISRLNEMMDANAKQSVTSAEKIEVLSNALTTSSELDEGLKDEIKVLAESAGASAANIAAEQATIELMPDFIDRSVEERLSQLSKVYLTQVKSCNRSAQFAAILSLIAVGLVLLWP